MFGGLIMSLAFIVYWFSFRGILFFYCFAGQKSRLGVSFIRSGVCGSMFVGFIVVLCVFSCGFAFLFGLLPC